MLALQQTDLLSCKVSQPAETKFFQHTGPNSDLQRRGMALNKFSLQQRSLLLNQLNFRKNTLEASYKYNVKKSVQHTRMHAVCLPMYENCKLLPHWKFHQASSPSLHFKAECSCEHTCWPQNWADAINTKLAGGKCLCRWNV